MTFRKPGDPPNGMPMIGDALRQDDRKKHDNVHGKNSSYSAEKYANFFMAHNIFNLERVFYKNPNEKEMAEAGQDEPGMKAMQGRRIREPGMYRTSEVVDGTHTEKRHSKNLFKLGKMKEVTRSHRWDGVIIYGSDGSCKASGVTSQNWSSACSALIDFVRETEGTNIVKLDFGADRRPPILLDHVDLNERLEYIEKFLDECEKKGAQPQLDEQVMQELIDFSKTKEAQERYGKNKAGFSRGERTQVGDLEGRLNRIQERRGGLYKKGGEWLAKQQDITGINCKDQQLQDHKKYCTESADKLKHDKLPAFKGDDDAKKTAYEDHLLGDDKKGLEGDAREAAVKEALKQEYADLADRYSELSAVVNHMSDELDAQTDTFDMDAVHEVQKEQEQVLEAAKEELKDLEARLEAADNHIEGIDDPDFKRQVELNQTRAKTSSQGLTTKRDGDGNRVKADRVQELEDKHKANVEKSAEERKERDATNEAAAQKPNAPRT